jgi:hypothetical protein
VVFMDLSVRPMQQLSWFSPGVMVFMVSAQYNDAKER